MHFATNDVWSNKSPQQILAAWTTLVQQMRASKPTMKILVAQIIPVAPPTLRRLPAADRQPQRRDPGVGGGRGTEHAASPITVVDQWTGWNAATDTSDGVHPNDAGIVKLANRWYPALTAALNGTTPTRPRTPTATPTPTPTRTPTPTVSPSPSPTFTMPPADGCTATYTVASQWPGGFVANVRVKPWAVALPGWRVAITLPDGAVTNAWSSQPTTSGTATTFAPAPWNGTVPVGGYVDFGFQGTGDPTASWVTCTRA